MTIFDQFLTPNQASAPFSEHALFQGMFDFEAALAQAQAAEGLITTEAARAIASVCRADLYDLPAMLAASGRAGSIAIPLVQQLRACVALFSAEAASAVHLGSTSQDVLDTAMVLATRQSLQGLDTALAQLVDALLRLAQAHADTPVLARTLMQPAQVTSMGLKFLNWAEPLQRARQRLKAAARHALVLQLGGAIGTLSGMQDERTGHDHGPAVAQGVANALGLALPSAPWHTQRDDWVRLGMEAAVVTGSLGKLATDLALMSQAEVAELTEPDGANRGGSTAMPHKRNPVGAMVALAAAQRAPHRAGLVLSAMGQEHERGLGNWQAELAEWSGLFTGAHAAALALVDVFATEGSPVNVHADRMRANIDALHGLVFASSAARVLSAHMSTARAQALLEQLSRRAASEAQPLQALLEQAIDADPALRKVISKEAIQAAFDPAQALGAARAQLLQRLPAVLAAQQALSTSDN